MKRLFFIFIIICTVVGSVYFLKKKGSIHATINPAVILAKVERGNIAMTVSTMGRIVANLDIDIKCKASGKVISLPYDVSDIVKRGDLLMELDPIDEQKRVKQAGVLLSSSQARLSQASLNLQIEDKRLSIERRLKDEALKSALAHSQYTDTALKRKKYLLDKNLVSHEEFDAARTDAIKAASELERAKIAVEKIKIEQMAREIKQQEVLLAQAQVESDKISLSIAKQGLEDTKVFAPIDGVVIARNVQIGQIISSGITNISGGTTVMTLSDLSHILVIASVDESEIGKVKIGQTAKITVDALPDRNFTGIVNRIATKGVNISNVVTFEVRLEVLEENKYLLKPEMTANVDINILKEEDCVFIPIEGVFLKEGRSFVRIKRENGSIQERQIEVGITDGEKIKIESGLVEGEILIIDKERLQSRWQNPKRV